MISEKFNFAMEYNEYYATPKEGGRIFVGHPISVVMESGIFSEDYSGKYYLI